MNLIPYNPVRGLTFHTPRPGAVARFVEILEQGGLTAAIRHRKGADRRRLRAVAAERYVGVRVDCHGDRIRETAKHTKYTKKDGEKGTLRNYLKRTNPAVPSPSGRGLG